jgi:hypothetical protein
MRYLKNKLTSSKNTKNIQSRKGKSFGYQVLGFGAGGSAAVAPTAAWLVIAGGGVGGGSSNMGGGGGAGGYRTSAGTSGGGASAEDALELTVGTEYTITVGAGGSGRLGGNESRNNWFRYY